MSAARCKQVLVLGSTGSIGCNTLDVVAQHPGRYQVYGLVAATQLDCLMQQALTHHPQVLVVCGENNWQAWQQSERNALLHARLGYAPLVLRDTDLPALCASPDVDVVVAAIVGAAGLRPTLLALQAGKHVLLANKEALVLGGRFMMQACQRSGAVLLPIDSEHNAIFQCLPAQVQKGQAVQPHHGVERLWLTASGGPLRTLPLADLAHIGPEQALLHPNWRMGPKVSIDSATMANKALELVEALWLFGLPHERLSVLVHPQSIVHSLVEYADGSVLAQLGCPDMRTPIAHALAWPERIQAGVERLNLAKLGSLTFEEPNLERFPMLRLGFEVLRNPEVLAPIFNAANEVAVHQFLHGTISLPSISSIATYCLERFSGIGVQTLDDALFLDAQVREAALAWIKDTH